MTLEKIKQKIKQLELAWHKESNNDNLTYLNGQLTAWNEILREQTMKEEQDYKAMNEESKPQLKQTAVEWLVEEIEKHYIINNGSLNPTIVMELKRQAKQMEKGQMFEYIKNMYCNGDASLKFHLEEFEQYYNKTYGNEDKSSE